MRQKIRRARIGISFATAIVGLIVIVLFMTSRFSSSNNDDELTSTRLSHDTTRLERSSDDSARIDVASQRAAEAPVTSGAGESPVRDGTITVFDAVSEGVADALVIGFRDSDMLFEATTNERGIIHVDQAATKDPFMVVVISRDLPPTLLSVEESASHHTLRLPTGAGSIAGRLLIDGKAPERIETLELAPGHGTYFISGEELPRGVLTAIHRAERSFDSVATSTWPDGSFRFDHLPANFWGSIALPEHLTAPYEFGMDRISVEGFTEDLLIEATRQSVLRGRCEDAEGRAAPSAVIEVICSLRNGVSGSGYFRLTTSLNGTFARGLRDPTPDEISVAASLGGVRVERNVKGPFAGDVDIGTLILPVRRKVVLEVRDPELRPIAGARAFIDDPDAAYLANADGVILLDGIPTCEVSVDVGARARASKTVSVPSEASSPIRVILEPSNELVIRVEDAAGHSIDDLQVCLEADASPFVDGAPLPPLSSRSAGSWYFDDGPFARQFRVVLVVDKDGIGRIGCFEPGQTFRLSVQEIESRRVFAESDVISLAATEKREIKLRLAQNCSRIVEGTIRERATGNPVPFAEVRLEEGNDFGEAPRTHLFTGLEDRSARTDRFGRFRFMRVSQKRGVVIATARGFVEERTETLDFESTQPIELALSKAEPIVIDVIDDDGRPLEVEAKAYSRDGTRTAKRLERGRLVFEALGPRKQLDLSVNIGGKSFYRLVEASTSPITVQLPSHGTIEIAWSTAIPSDVPYKLSLGGPPDPHPYPNRPLKAGSRFLGPWTVLPGLYAVYIMKRQSANNGCEMYSSVATAVDVRIDANQTTRITLDY